MGLIAAIGCGGEGKGLFLASGEQIMSVFMNG